jgi:hypothetical protein
MGYTHYFYRKQKLNAKQFTHVVEDFQKVIPLLGVSLKGGSGEGPPNINNNAIIFNGDGEELSHETFYLPRDLNPEKHQHEEKGLYFEFCKTDRKPYDIAVTACLVIAKHHLKSQITVSSDGDLSEWQDAIKIVYKTLGYGEKFKL